MYTTKLVLNNGEVHIFEINEDEYHALSKPDVFCGVSREEPVLFLSASSNPCRGPLVVNMNNIVYLQTEKV